MPNNPKAVDNLIPAKKGEVRNPKGKPKGTKNLATLVRELESEDFDWTHVPIKNKEAVAAMGSPWKAILTVALGQAISGDKHAREWLRKSGYGDKLDLTTGGEPMTSLVRFVGGDESSNG